MRIAGDSRNLRQLLDTHLDVVPEIPCVVGSPPYNVGVQGYPSGYDDYLGWDEYITRAMIWAENIYEVLCPGGRAWINVQPTVPFMVGEPGGDRVNLEHIWNQALLQAGLKYRDTVTWVQDSFDGGCAWGSWRSPNAPNLRGSHEVVLLYYKHHWPRYPEGAPKEKDGHEDWTDLTRNVWKIPPANSKGYRGVNLPAKFPEELAARCIRLSTWPGEYVLDPWAGHCSTGKAADALGRESIMVDLGFAEEEP